MQNRPSLSNKKQGPRFTLEIMALPTNLNPTKSTETEHKSLGVGSFLLGGKSLTGHDFHAGGVEIAEADCHWDLESLSWIMVIPGYTRANGSLECGS